MCVCVCVWVWMWVWVGGKGALIPNGNPEVTGARLPQTKIAKIVQQIETATRQCWLLRPSVGPRKRPL